MSEAPYAGGPRPSVQQPRTPARYVAAGGVRTPFTRNAMLVIAQLLVITQGVFTVITGVQLIRQGLAAGAVFKALGAERAVISVVTVGGLTAGAGVLLGLAGMFVGRPSPGLRWLITVWEIAVLTATVLALTMSGPIVGLLVLGVALVSGLGFVSVAAALAIEAAIIYALAVHPATYRAFARDALL
jgi:hypothetical protein